jgi:HK97 family phage major capsid protein
VTETPAALLDSYRTAVGKHARLREQRDATRSAEKRDRLQRGIDRQHREALELLERFRDALPTVDPEVAERQRGIEGELARLCEKADRHGDLNGRDEQYFDELVDGFERSLDELLTASQRAASDDARRGRVLQAFGRGAVDDVDDHLPALRSRPEGRPMRTHTARTDGIPDADNALRHIDHAHRSGTLPDHAAERAERLLTEGSKASRSAAARWAAATGDPDYLEAFGKQLGDPERGHMLWTEPERAAWQRVAEFQSEQRQMGTGAAAGGAMIPLTLDPAILLTSAGSTNPLRNISRVVQTATNTWQGVTSAGTVAEWKAEHAEAADASFPVAAAPIPVHLGDAFVPYSFEIGQDAVGFTQELGKVLADAADQLQATAYTTGTGIGQPQGVITGLAAAQVVDTNAAYAAGDVVALQNALPPRFQDGARWAGNLAVLNATEAFETTNGHLRFPSIQNDPPRLLRKPVHELSNMSADMATAASRFLLYGDFSNFVIVDRIGTTLELVPHPFGANNRPTGQRGALMWFRTGSAVVAPNAFRVLARG